MPSNLTEVAVFMGRELYYGLANHGKDMKYGVRTEECEVVIGKGALFVRRIAYRRRLIGGSK